MSGTTVIDRRDEPLERKFGTDIERFHERNREVMRKAVNQEAGDRSFKDIGKKGMYVPIPKESIQEPVIQHAQGTGSIRRVFPGNKFDKGDKIPISGGGGGQGGKQASDDDTPGKDDFVWVSPEEFLDILFEGRKLPDMTKLRAEGVHIKEKEHAGFTNVGPSHKMDASLTEKKRKGDEIVLSKSSERRLVKNLTEQFNILAKYDEALPELDFARKSKKEKIDYASEQLKTVQERYQINLETDTSNKDNLRPLLEEAVTALKDKLRDKVTDDQDRQRIQVLEERLPEQMKAKEKAGGYRRDHLTYRYDDEIPQPMAKAVMFCQMDVSFSMQEEEKAAAKSFYWLLYNFLQAKYDQTDIVFIAHTTQAWETDEHEFFHGQESGGTVVSSCLEKTKEIIDSRYPPSEWNIYCAQASDGDNVVADNSLVTSFMEELLEDVQAFYYTEVGQPYGQTLLPIYQEMAQRYQNLHTTRILEPGKALDAFKKFFPADNAAMAAPQP